MHTRVVDAVVVCLTAQDSCPDTLRFSPLNTGVIGTKTVSNHLIDVLRVLGIEACRKSIIDQIGTTMASHSLDVDVRHLSLLGDGMVSLKVGGSAVHQCKTTDIRSRNPPLLSALLSHLVFLRKNSQTIKGILAGITRFGIAQMKDSTLMLASFEKTTDHLFDAAWYAKRDSVAGISESIVMGQPDATTGTGA